MVEHLPAGRIAGSLLLCEASDASAHGKTGDSGSDILRLSVAHAIQEHTIYGTLPGTCFRLDRLWRYRLFISDFTIIFLYFYKFRKPENRGKIHYLNLATYYYGILAFDISILYFAAF